MANLLNIQASPSGAASVSRRLSEDFVADWRSTHPNGKVILRDLTLSQLPFVASPWIVGRLLPVEQRTPEMQQAVGVSEELIKELFAADHILIGTPMFNYTVPANLKAWIDLIVIPTITHTGPPERKGLVTGKRCTVIVASGGVYEEGRPEAALDFVSGYLKRILGFIGITEVNVVRAGGSILIASGSTTIEEHLAQFRPAVLALARK